MKANLGSAGMYGYPYNLVSDILGAQHMEEWKEHEPLKAFFLSWIHENREF